MWFVCTAQISFVYSSTVSPMMCPAVPATQVMAYLSIPRTSAAEYQGLASRSVGHISLLWGQDITHPLVMWAREEWPACQCTWVLWNRYCYWVPCVPDCECHIHQHLLLTLEKGSKARNLGCACPQNSSPQLPGENALPTQLESLRRLINNFSLLALAWKWEEMVYSCEELGQP